MTVSPFDEGVMAAETGMTKETRPIYPVQRRTAIGMPVMDFAVEAHEATELDNEYETTVTLD